MRKRESNFEVLRILAMILVLLFHTLKELESNEPFLNSISMMGVPLFIMISGWFGIKPSIRSFASLIFQCLFFSLGLSIFGRYMSGISLEPQDFFLTWYWFIIAYIGLYILAPVLNAFIEKSSEKQFRNFLIFFFVFEFLYGFVCQSSAGFNKGLTTISLIGTYLLARYVKLYPNKLSSLPCFCDLLISIGIIVLEGSFMYMANRFECNFSERTTFYSYTNPAVLLSSLFILLFFSKLRFKSRFINYVASSCLAVYLFHSHRTILHSYFADAVNYASASEVRIVYVGVIAAFFVVGILLDQLRKGFWYLVERLIFKNTEK